MELNLGNLSVDSSGRASFSGLSSGIDFAGAVDAIIEAKRVPIVRLESKISDNDAKIAAFSDLRALMDALSGSVGTLRGAVTFRGAGDVFKNKQVFATTSRTDSKVPALAANLIGATVVNSAIAGSHDIEVRRVATAHKISTKEFASLTADLNFSGSFTITNGTTDTVISVATTDSLLDIRDRINNANTGTKATGVSASIVSVTSTQNFLVITKDATGSDIVITETVSSGATADANATLTTTTASSPGVAQVDTLTLAGTIEQGDIYRATINGFNVDYTVLRTDTTLTQVRNGLVAAINANANVNGAVTAASGASAGELTITADTAGTAFTRSTATFNSTAFTADAAATTTIIQLDTNLLPQIDDVTLAGAVDVGDVFTITFEGTVINYTVVPSDTTLDNVRDGLIAAINANGTINGDVTASAGPGTGVVRLTGLIDQNFNPATTAGATDYTPVNDQAATAATTTANVPAVAQVDTVTLTGAVDVGDVFSVVVNGATVTYTVQTGDTTLDNVRNGLVAAINADATVGPIVTAAATGGTGQFTITADTGNTAFTASASAVDTPGILNLLGLSTTFGTNSFRNGLTAGSKIGTAAGFSKILIASSEANNAFLVDYVASTKKLTLTRTSDGTSQTITLTTPAIASGKTETASFTTFGNTTIVLDENFNKATDISVDADTFTKTGGTAAIADPTTIKIVDSVGDVSGITSTTLTFSNFSGGNNITITAGGGTFTATGVNLSTTGAKTVTLSDGNGNSVDIKFTLSGAFNGSETAASIDLQELESLVTSTNFSNELQRAQKARFTTDGLVDTQRYESNVLTSKTAALETLATITNKTGSYKIDGTNLAYDTTVAGTADSLQQIADDINNAAISGVTAAVIEDGIGFRLDIKTTNASIAITDTSGLFVDLGITNDLVIERASNTVSDVLAGVTLTLFQAEPGTTVKLDIEKDLSAVKTAIDSFVTAYNALRVFINTQNQVDAATGVKGDDSGVLFGNSAMNEVRDEMANIVGLGTTGVNSAFSVLAQIGVELVDNNAQSDVLNYDTLKIDSTKLDAALLSNSDDIRRLFAFDFSTSDPNVSLLSFTGKSTFKTGGYKLNVNGVNYSSVSAKVTGDLVALNTVLPVSGSGTFTINGRTISYNTTTDTLTTLKNAINVETANTGVTATIKNSGSLFTLDLTATNKAITVGGDTGTLLTSLNITANPDVITSANIDNIGLSATVSGRSITLTDKSGAEGLQFFYSGTGAASNVQLDLTQGVASQIFFSFDTFLDKSTGSIQAAIANLEGQNLLSDDRIETMELRIITQRESLTSRFLAAELAMAQMESLLSSIRQSFELLARGDS